MTPMPSPDTLDRDALRACPFCGSAAEWNTGQNGDGSPWRYIACEDCEAMGPASNDDASSVSSWNRRAPAPASVAWDGLVERLEQAQEWMRRPDWEDDFSLEDIAAWMNDRPTSIIPAVIAALAKSEARAEAAEANAREQQKWADQSEGELNAISLAIGSPRFMDPPDGGSVTLSEQVARMRQALEAAEARLAEAGKVIEPFADAAGEYFARNFNNEDLVAGLLDVPGGRAVGIKAKSLFAARTWMEGGR
jgi:Lar family restriction alleviation protein